MKRIFLSATAVVAVIVFLSGCFKDANSARCIGNTLSQDRVNIENFLTANGQLEDYVYSDANKTYSKVLEIGVGESFKDTDSLNINQSLAILNGAEVQTTDRKVKFAELNPYFKYYFSMLKNNGKMVLIVPSSQSGFGCNGGYDPNSGAQIIPANAQIKYTYTVSLLQPAEN